MKSRYQYCTQTAVAALLIGLTGAAQAQDAMETVTVTGFRASLATALNAKQNSNLVMESVASEDIGKMPDQNVTESLQRLPGVQIARDQGKGTRVLINGLRQNLTTLNGDIFLTGKEFYVSGEAAHDGAGHNSQYASLEGIPSEEIGGIDIYKSPNAALTEGGMGGIINLKTRDPLAAADGFSMTAALRGTSTSYSSLARLTPNATLVAAFKPNNVFAITGSISYDNVDTHTKEYEAYNRSPWNVNVTTGVKGYTGVGSLNETNGKTNLPNGQSYISPYYGYFSDLYGQNRTIGATLGAAWNVSSSIQTSINWFYSHISDKQTNYSNKVGFNGSGASSNAPDKGIPGIDLDKPYSIDGNGVVDSATFYLQGAETATLLQKQGSDANNIQWHTSFDNGGPISATFDVSWARSQWQLKAAQQDIEHGFYSARDQSTSAAPTAPGCNNFSPSCTNGNPAIQLNWNSGGDSGLPSAQFIGTYADVLSNPNYALFKSAWAWNHRAKQQGVAIRGAVVYKPAFLKSVEGSITGGFRIATRDVWWNSGRYLTDGYDVNGNYIANCCYAAGNGPALYYQDPGYAAIPWDTAASNPKLALSVKNWMFGNMIVKDPVAGGMNSPETFYNTIWNQAANVPSLKPSAVIVGGTAVPCDGSAGQPAACNVAAKTKTPNDSEKLYPDTLSSFNVHEATQSFYLMGDMGNRDMGFHLNAGARIIFTSQVVKGASAAPVVYSYGTAGWNGTNSNNIPFAAVKHSVDVLPSFNLALYPTDNQIVRLAAARVMSPADLFNIGVGQSYNFTRETGGRTNIHNGQKDGFRFANGDSGNPQLDPYRATQVNLSWEYYFAPEALASVGTFFKQIDSFEVRQPVDTLVMDDFGGSSGPVNMPINGGNGKIYGLELSGQYVSDLGLGFAANYTYTQSTSNLKTAFSKHLSIPDVSAHAATATVFFEKFGFDARMSYSWRSKAVNGGVGGATFSPINNYTGKSVDYGVFSAPYGQLDAQIAYNFLEHFQIYVSAQNLTEEAYHTYLQFPNEPFTYDNSGARYFFGVRASF